MAVGLSPVFNAAQFFDSNGNPLSGGKIFAYVSGSSSSKLNTYSDSDGLIPNTNPIVLDSSGMPPVAIWLDLDYTYRLTLTLSDGTTVLQYIDDVTGITP